MPVVINEFEVVPQTAPAENKMASDTVDKKAARKPEISDYEIRQMLAMRAERLARVAAH
jgi:hypothetical protein